LGELWGTKMGKFMRLGSFGGHPISVNMWNLK